MVMSFFSRIKAILNYEVFATKADSTYAVEYQSHGGMQLPERISNDFKSYAKEGYRRNDTVHKCISYIARNGAGIKWGLYTDKTLQKEIDGHELLDRWTTP